MKHARSLTIARRARGFTLIELLVVVAIIALLISILLPSLKKAREQGKRVKCQASMRGINTGLMMYFNEQNIFPVAYTYTGGNSLCPCGWCTWSFGGWLGKNPFWATANGGCFRIPANKRPLTVYMNKSVSGPVTQGTQLAEMSGQPIYQCPSDKRSYQWQWIANPSDAYSAYDDVGTSFQQNFYWWEQTNKYNGGAVDLDLDGKIERTPGLVAAEPGGCGSNWPGRFRQGRAIWKKHSEKNTSRFVTLGEDPFDYAVVNQVGTIGFHGEFTKHNLGFLDTHVEYLKLDTVSNRHAGTLWTIIDEELEAGARWL